MVPLKELLENLVITPNYCTTEISQNVLIDLKNTQKNKTYYTNSLENDMQTTKWLANEGLIGIYGNTNVLARARVEKELKVIDSLVVIF
jgi:DNA polymerase-3 subunit alpha/error-prone DNA polymerase